MSDVSSEEWQEMMLSLVQAMLGAVSCNFRMVSISHDDTWVFSFFLERESPEDREEIDDILCEVEALQESEIEYRVNVFVGEGYIPWPKLPERVIYKRKE